MNKQDQLDTIKADIIADAVCSELAQQATNLVFGDGNPNADIVFVGEAPGRQEDEQGLPFVGASGKFLSEMLAGINLRRQQVYITNIVKYRPPNNRDPEPAEKAAFLPYLHRQLAVIEPKLVVTLGRHSMTCFLPTAKISEIHGKPKRIKWDYGYGKNLVGNKRMDDVINSVDNGAKTQIATYLDESHGNDEKRNEAYDGYAEVSIADDDKVIRQEGLQQGELSSTTGNPGTLVILPLYHPAAALYNGALRATLTEDFSNITTILNQIRKGN